MNKILNINFITCNTSTIEQTQENNIKSITETVTNTTFLGITIDQNWQFSTKLVRTYREASFKIINDLLFNQTDKTRNRWRRLPYALPRTIRIPPVLSNRGLGSSMQSRYAENTQSWKENIKIINKLPSCKVTLQRKKVSTLIQYQCTSMNITLSIQNSPQTQNQSHSYNIRVGNYHALSQHRL